MGEADVSPVKLLDEVERQLKLPSVSFPMIERGVNTSIALLAIDGLRHYLQGDKRQAADDLAAAAEEIKSRLKG